MNREDLEITTEHPNQGGQHVGISSGVRVYHIPTNTSVICNIGRSQHQNREIALTMLEWGLLQQRK